MSALPFQGGVILKSFVPDSGFGTYAMLTAMVILPLKRLGLFLVNEMHTKPYTGPRLRSTLCSDKFSEASDFCLTYI